MYPPPLQVKKRGPAAAITSLAKRPRVESTEETSQSRSIFQYLESWISLARARGSMLCRCQLRFVLQICRWSSGRWTNSCTFCCCFFNKFQESPGDGLVYSPLVFFLSASWQTRAQNPCLVWNETLTWSFPGIQETHTTEPCPPGISRVSVVLVPPENAVCVLQKHCR